MEGGQKLSRRSPSRVHSERSGEGGGGHGEQEAILPPSWLRGTEEHGVGGCGGVGEARESAPLAPRVQPRSGGVSSSGSRRDSRGRDRDGRDSSLAAVGRGGPRQGGG